MVPPSYDDSSTHSIASLVKRIILNIYTYIYIGDWEGSEGTREYWDSWEGALFCFPYNFRALSAAKWDDSKNAAAVGGALASAAAAGSSISVGAGGLASKIPGGMISLLVASLGLGMAGALADLAVPTPAVTVPSKIFGLGPIPPFHVDDNLVVPVFSAYACTRIFRALGWDSERLELARFILF